MSARGVLLGHESIKTTSDTYGHLVPDAHEQMAGVIAKKLAGVRAAAATRSPVSLKRITLSR